MQHRRALIGAAAGVLVAAGASGLAGSLLDPPAAAATATYAVAASGAGVKLSIGGTDLVGGTSKASAGSGRPVLAEGVGELTPGALTDQKATVSSAGGSQTADRVCAQPANPFPAPLASVVTLGVACGAASAAETGAGLPTASATGQVVSVGLGSPSALPSTTVVPGSALATRLQSTLGTLPTLPPTGLPLPTVLGQVAKSLGGSGSITGLLTATLGPSTSTVSTSGTSVVATSKNTGLRLALLDGLGAGGGPLLTVSVGAAAAQSAVDTTTGSVHSTDTPAVVSVTVAPPAGPAQTVAVAPGLSQTFLAGTPLATTVAGGAGSTTGQGTGHGTATATGVTVDALEGVGAGPTGTDGGLAVSLGAASSGATGSVPVPVAAASATAAPPAVPAPAPAVTGATTVHTGEPWAGPLPLALLLLSLLTGLGLLARHRLVPLVRLAGRVAGRVPATVSHAAAGSGHRGLLRSPSGPGTGPAASSSGTAPGTGGGADPAVPGDG